MTALVTAREVMVAPVIGTMSPPSLVTASEPSAGLPANCGIQVGSACAFAPRPGVSAWLVTFAPATVPSVLMPTTTVRVPPKPNENKISHPAEYFA